MFTNEQIKKLKGDIYKLDILRDKKREINDELRHDYNEKVGSSFAISDTAVKVKRRK